MSVWNRDQDIWKKKSEKMTKKDIVTLQLILMRGDR